MLIFDKTEIRERLKTEDVFDLIAEWGGNPTQTSFGFISDTICHNLPGVGSHKLYYYENEGLGLFHCYTGCIENSFDIFELTIKVFEIQKKQILDLNDAIRYIAARVGIAGRLDDVDGQAKTADWDILSNYDRIQEIKSEHSLEIKLKEYDNSILDKFNYNLLITPWLKENINQDVIRKTKVGYYLGGDQITIPHYDADSRLVGVRGRTVCDEEASRFGKYRPLYIHNILYSHPLGLNLYGLNWAKDNIQQIQKAIVFESEKSVLQYMSYFGLDNSIAVACCGSSLSVHQMNMLLAAGAKEVVIGFDKQFETTNSEASKRWSGKLQKIHNKYKNDCQISFIWDKNNLLPYKASPTDIGAEVFLKLFKERIII